MASIERRPGKKHVSFRAVICLGVDAHGRPMLASGGNRHSESAENRHLASIEINH